MLIAMPAVRDTDSEERAVEPVWAEIRPVEAMVSWQESSAARRIRYWTAKTGLSQCRR